MTGVCDVYCYCHWGVLHCNQIVIQKGTEVGYLLQMTDQEVQCKIYFESLNQEGQNLWVFFWILVINSLWPFKHSGSYLPACSVHSKWRNRSILQLDDHITSLLAMRWNKLFVSNKFCFAAISSWVFYVLLTVNPCIIL